MSKFICGDLFIAVGIIGSLLVRDVFTRFKIAWWKLIFKILLALLLIYVGARGSILVKEGVDDLNKQSAISKLDGFSMLVMDATKGLIFNEDLVIIGKNKVEHVQVDPGTIRYLISLNLVESNPYPSKDKITYSYNLTREGRFLLKEKWGREFLYPEIFCDLYNIHWWGGYPDKFAEKKREFEKKYKVSYDDSWKRLKELQPDFDRYLYMTPYEKAMKELVKPLLKEIGWLDN